MNKKIIIASFVLFVVVLILISYDQISRQSVQKLAGETPGYICTEDKPCVTCMFEGKLCHCGPVNCQCGEQTVNQSVCG
jgi:hypothetical protein